MNEDFLPGEQCPRCGGPVLAEPHRRQEFVEATFDYTEQTVWICYMCGREITLDSEPRYLF